MARIELKNLVKRFGKTSVVHGVDLTVEEGEFVVLVGPSGCGKSTILRMIAGLEEVTEGQILIDGAVVNEREPRDRNIAMVFQNYAIYPHVTVAENIGFGLYRAQLTKAEKRARIEQAARTLGLLDLLDRRPAQLSGGQRQRVAMGRAMVRDPSAFLYDEPLSNLDAQLRAQMRVEIKRLHQALGATSIFVTHDQVEAMTMADRIVVMRDGRILQVGSPMSLFDHPTDLFTAKFIGSPTMNLLPGTLAFGVVALDAGGAVEPPMALGARSGDVLLGVRPHDLTPGDAGALRLTGVVRALETLGTETMAHLDVGGVMIVATTPPHASPKLGESVTVSAPAERLHLFDAGTEKAFSRR